MITYTSWMDRVGDNVSRAVEAATGDIHLLHNSMITDEMEAKLDAWWREGLPPREAARHFLALHAWKQLCANATHAAQRARAEGRTS
jgi:hypothetical protein